MYTAAMGMKQELARAVCGVGLVFCIASVGLYYLAASLSSKLDEG